MDSASVPASGLVSPLATAEEPPPLTPIEGGLPAPVPPAELLPVHL